MLNPVTLEDLPINISGNVTIDPVTGCWRAAGLRHDKDGYARLGKQQAHRAVWQLLVGEIPADRPILDHVKARGCAWRDCIFIPHLEPVTVRQNTLRGNSFAAINALKTHCSTCAVLGCNCAYDLFNTYYSPDGRRDCRCCIRRRVREYQTRIRAERRGMLETGVIDLTGRNWAKRKMADKIKRFGTEPAIDIGPPHGRVMLGTRQWRTSYPEDFPVTTTRLVLPAPVEVKLLAAKLDVPVDSPGIQRLIRTINAA